MNVIVGICTMYWERVILVNNIELQVISNGYVQFIRQVHDPGETCLTADRRPPFEAWPSIFLHCSECRGVFHRSDGQLE